MRCLWLVAPALWLNVASAAPTDPLLDLLGAMVTAEGRVHSGHYTVTLERRTEMPPEARREQMEALRREHPELQPDETTPVATAPERERLTWRFDHHQGAYLSERRALPEGRHEAMLVEVRLARALRQAAPDGPTTLVIMNLAPDPLFTTDLFLHRLADTWLDQLRRGDMAGRLLAPEAGLQRFEIWRIDEPLPFFDRITVDPRNHRLVRVETIDRERDEPSAAYEPVWGERRGLPVLAALHVQHAGWLNDGRRYVWRTETFTVDDVALNEPQPKLTLDIPLGTWVRDYRVGPPAEYRYQGER